MWLRICLATLTTWSFAIHVFIHQSFAIDVFIQFACSKRLFQPAELPHSLAYIIFFCDAPACVSDSYQTSESTGHSLPTCRWHPCTWRLILVQSLSYQFSTDNNAACKTICLNAFCMATLCSASRVNFCIGTLYSAARVHFLWKKKKKTAQQAGQILCITFAWSADHNDLSVSSWVV